MVAFLVTNSRIQANQLVSSRSIFVLLTPSRFLTEDGPRPKCLALAGLEC
jgi:hypothetical protein